MSTINYPTREAPPVTVASSENNPVGAVIDIGSNAVKLLIGQVTGTTIARIYLTRKAVRLGQGAFQTRRLQPEIIEQVAGTVAEFAHAARSFSPSVFRILATSAVREAINRWELVRAVETRAQKPVEILSGEDEARLLFEGVRRETGLAGSDVMVVDVGGGSTQIIVNDNGVSTLYYSFPFGSLRLLETLGLSGRLSRNDLATCRAAAANFVLHQVIPAIEQTRFEGALFNRMRLVATGRKLRGLAQVANPRANLDESDSILSLSSERLTAMIEGLWEMPSHERAAILAIEEEDADVILTAAVTLEAISQRFDFEVLHASRSNLRQGAILRSFAERRKAAVPNQWR